MEEWKQKRLKGIGGSDASAILGLNPYMTNIDLFNIKTGKKIQEDISNREVVKYGVTMEPILINMFSVDNLNNYKVDHRDYDLRYSKDYDFLIGSLDGVLIDKKTNEQGILEIKTCLINQHNFNKWNNRIPDNYYVQALHYLLVTDYDFAVVFTLLKYHNSSLELKTFRINGKEVKEDLNYLLNKEIEFWNEHVLKNREPNLIINI